MPHLTNSKFDCNFFFQSAWYADLLAPPVYRVPVWGEELSSDDEPVTITHEVQVHFVPQFEPPIVVAEAAVQDVPTAESPIVTVESLASEIPVSEPQLVTVELHTSEIHPTTEAQLTSTVEALASDIPSSEPQIVPLEARLSPRAQLIPTTSDREPDLDLVSRPPLPTIVISAMDTPPVSATTVQPVKR
jgi:hypothetical protein